MPTVKLRSTERGSIDRFLRAALEGEETEHLWFEEPVHEGFAEDVPWAVDTPLDIPLSPSTRVGIALAGLTAQLIATSSPPGEALRDVLPHLMIRRIAALEEKCAVMESELAAIRSQLRVQHKVVSISSLRTNRYVLTRPLQLNLEISGNEVIAEYVEVGIYGVGDSEQQAIRDFCQCLVEYYECLQDAQGNLAKRAREHWCILRELVAKRAAVQAEVARAK